MIAKPSRENDITSISFFLFLFWGGRIDHLPRSCKVGRRVCKISHHDPIFTVDCVLDMDLSQSTFIPTQRMQLSILFLSNHSSVLLLMYLMLQYFSCYVSIHNMIFALFSQGTTQFSDFNHFQLAPSMSFMETNQSTKPTPVANHGTIYIHLWESMFGNPHLSNLPFILEVS